MKTVDGVTYKALGYHSYNDMWMDYINNFLTIQGFADHHHIEKRTAIHLLDIGK